MEVANNQIYFNVKNNQVSVKSRGPITFDDLLQVCVSGLLGAMNQIVDSASDEEKEVVKGGIYDRFNTAVSRTLEIFAPEYELHPGLTARAILEAENDIINREYRKKKKEEDANEGE